MRKSCGLAFVLVLGLAVSAEAQTAVLVCAAGGDSSISSTYYIDFSARTVTSTAHDVQGRMQTFSAEITDSTIRYYVGPSFVSIDRYSLIMRNPLTFFQCSIRRERPL